MPLSVVGVLRRRRNRHSRCFSVTTMELSYTDASFILHGNITGSRAARDHGRSPIYSYYRDSSFEIGLYSSKGQEIEIISSVFNPSNASHSESQSRDRVIFTYQERRVIFLRAGHLPPPRSGQDFSRSTRDTRFPDEAKKRIFCENEFSAPHEEKNLFSGEGTWKILSGKEEVTRNRVGMHSQRFGP